MTRQELTNRIGMQYHTANIDEEDRFKVMLRADSQNGKVVTETTMISESGLYSL